MQQTDLGSTVRAPVAEAGQWFATHRAQLVGALVLLVVGWLLALLLRALAVRVVRGLGRVVPGRALQGGFGRFTAERHVSDLVGVIVFWAVLLFFAAAALEALGLEVLGASLGGIGLYVPRVLAAVLVMAVGLVVGNLAREAVRAGAAAAGTPFAPAAGQFARYAVIGGAALIAVGELGIDVTLLTTILAVVVAALLGGIALAFGTGARTAVSNIIGSHYVRQTYEVGNRVRIGDVEGTISAITAVAVIIQVPRGQVVVPAKQFNESVSTLVAAGGAS